MCFCLRHVGHLPVFRCSRCSRCRWCPVWAESWASGGVFPVVPVFFCFLVVAPQLLGLDGRTPPHPAAAAAASEVRRFRLLLLFRSGAKKVDMPCTTYEPRTLPLDDEGFVQAFDVEDGEGMQVFFDDYGFVVVNGVLNEDERVATISDIWSIIEGFCGGKFNISRDDPSSWQKRWPGGGPGLIGPAKTAASWHNRANPRLRAVFERIVGTDRLLSSVDNNGVLRPTRHVPMRPLPPQVPCRTDVVVMSASASTEGAADEGGQGDDSAVDQPTWKTTSKWLHWDLNPFH